MRWRMRARIIAAAVAILAGPPAAVAAVWKDGCPAFFPPETAPTYTTDVKKHDGSAAFGTLPEIDSLLGPSRLATESWLSSVRPATGPASIGHELGARLVLQGNLTSGPMFGVIYAAYAIPGDGGYDRHLGDLTTFIGYRHTGYVLGPLFRTGIAARIAAGGPETARTSDELAGQRALVAINSPFRGASFGVEVPITASLEYRIEAIGCRNPFIDLRVDVAHWRRNEATPAVFAVPIELAIGAYPWETVALYAGVGEELRSSALVYRHLTRITFGLELHPTSKKSVRIGLRASVIAAGDVGGAELGLTLELLAPWWKGTLE